ncbi:MAG TPA: DNA-formamidopyrimidine glycosylase family protein [Methanocella sp.]|nr:DNA-formamidopyrimidine glycosylase family protein [Methanocella sp.]
MPELPEIYNLAKQMSIELEGKTIASVDIKQEKCLNMPPDDFATRVKGKAIVRITPKGKWVILSMESDTLLLLSLGMGGDVLYHQAGDISPEKYQLKLAFTDGTFLSIRFWWFGYAHAITTEEQAHHKMTASLGVSPLDDREFTQDRLRNIAKGSKKTVKAILLDQKIIAGIGNVYIQDILFKARLHPDRKAHRLSNAEIEALHRAIVGNLESAVSLCGLKYEKDLYGRPGGLGQEQFMVGYKEGQPCPCCGTTIEKIKTGSTSSYICPKCQI